MRGNKGEWSELYTLLKLISEGKLYLADQNINKIESIYYDILEVIRRQRTGEIKYTLTGDIVIIKGEDGKELIRLPISKFGEYAEILYSELVSRKVSSGSFEVPSLSKLINEIRLDSLKAGSTDKRDITLVVHDRITSSNPILGFSIKSRLGSPSTLLNASLATNFTFEIYGKNISEIKRDQINSIRKFKDKFSYLDSLGSKIRFGSVDNESFEYNLKMIDSSLPEILAIMVELYFRGCGRSIKELTQMLSEINPLGISVEDTSQFYSYKIKELLTNIALGMIPSSRWDGRYDATGGYIIVKEDGEILCYHIYNRNEFREYLYNNTRLESPSTTRHEYGRIFNEAGKDMIKLNLQIRFIK